MTVFPLAAAVTILLDGRPVQGYTGLFEAGGHIFAPVRPFVTRIADRIWYSGDRLAVQRDGKTVFIRLQQREPDALDGEFIPLRAVMNALGADVQYNEILHEVNIRLPLHPRVESPPPFDASAPQVAPTVVFTPSPEATPRPVWSGSPLPRRTPLPYSSSTPAPPAE